MNEIQVVLLETANGHKYCLPAGRIPFQEDEIRQTGMYEPATTETIRRFVKPGMTVVEGGACCGYHALNIAQAVGEHGRVYCFEANPLLIRFLEKNIEMNGYQGVVEIAHAGLWSEAGEMPFPMLQTGLGGASFKNPLQIAAVPTVQVRMISLDERFPEQRVDFIRMDIEGAELDVLKGAQRLLARDRPGLIMEWIPENSSGTDSRELFSLAQQYGYRMYRIGSAGLTGIKTPEELHDLHAGTHERDILCTTEEL